MELSTTLASGETLQNVEIWVVYGSSREEVAAGTVGGSAPHGLTVALTIELEPAEDVLWLNVLRSRFIFPHPRHPRPNARDANERILPSGERSFYKIVKRVGS